MRGEVLERTEARPDEVKDRLMRKRSATEQKRSTERLQKMTHYKKHKIPQENELTEEQQAEVNEQVEKYMDWVQEHRSAVIEAFSHKLHFVSKKGVPLRYMTPLKLDPALLEQPLYR